MKKQYASTPRIDGKQVFCVKTLGGKTYFVAADNADKARCYVRDKLKDWNDVAEVATQSYEVYII